MYTIPYLLKLISDPPNQAMQDWHAKGVVTLGRWPPTFGNLNCEKDEKLHLADILGSNLKKRNWGQ